MKQQIQEATKSSCLPRYPHAQHMAYNCKNPKHLPPYSAACLPWTSAPWHSLQVLHKP
eukprot:c23685_g1_i2 orf=3-173(-)